nr:conidiophore development regulator abaa [Quercus suber]
MGRRMLLHNGKQRGRNELIADEINQLTGEERSRKQISSHIQVLKPFVKHDPMIMKFLSKDDFHDHDQHRVAHRRRAHDSSRRIPRRRDSPHAEQRLSIDTMSEPIVPREHELEHYAMGFEPMNFQIFIQQKHREGIRRLHTYTQSVRQTPLPIPVSSDGGTWEQKFPLLSQLHAKTPLKCDVLIAESSLAIPFENYKNLLGVELGVQLQFCNRLPPDAQLRCDNSFYHNGQCFPEQNDPMASVSTTMTNDARGSEASVKFGSKFWAKHLSRLSQNITDTAQSGRQIVDEDVAAYISGITALQQISMPDRNGSFQPILVIFWTFRHASDARGLTKWSKLILPEPSTPGTLGSVNWGSRSRRTNSAFERDMSHGLPISHHTFQHLAPLSSYDYDSVSPCSVVSSYTWPTPSHQPSFNWSTANTNGTLDFHRRNVNFELDPLLGFGNSSDVVHNGPYPSTNELTANTDLECYSQSWNNNRYQTATNEFNELPSYASSNYDSDVNYAYDRDLIPGLAQMNCSATQPPHPASPFEEPYAFDLIGPSQSSHSRPHSRDMSPAGFSPHSNISPIHDRIPPFHDPRERSIPPNLITSGYNGAERDHASRSLQPPGSASRREPQVSGLFSRMATSSTHTRESPDIAAYNFDPLSSQPQAGPEGQVYDGTGHDARWRSPFALNVETPSPWRDARRRNLRRRPNSPGARQW